MHMIGSVYINGHDVSFMRNPMDLTVRMDVKNEEALDSIIEQCRDIKLKLMEARDE